MESDTIKGVDRLGRPLRDLRVSVTDRCNFRCRYCMPAEVFGPDYPFLPRDELLTFEEIIRLVKLFTHFGVKKIRLTGGEPLLRRDLPTLIRMVSTIPEIDDIALTTNGTLLPRFAQELVEAGLDRVNVSLDALHADTFARMSGGKGDVKQVLAGIDAAAAVGLRVKVNMVVQKGVNDGEILPMARYFKEKGHTLRFIEFMDVGNTNGWDLAQVVSKEEILARIGKEMPLIPLEPAYHGEVANRYRYEGSQTQVGVIASVSAPFCGSCTRARLSADGHLYTCLFASQGTDLRTSLRNGAGDEQLARLLGDVWLHRKDRYSQERTQRADGTHNKVEMSYIGG
ncbi:GTP 3',8-cyclase MoaA [Desmospora activa]|uniref:GTP 3',8-cyclase n=1 Tax=Desmospora activa DSM 45169 TaxID=1121389 RepID=A0A2T4Z0J7_9BACL|nr:GTP 3',8-cyclase MoaA [Desmospora activa]PTM53256.1 cyclic pyranopterin monophosphate synthase subunit MoaA [Desmospora activa DSM 45169]